MSTAIESPQEKFSVRKAVHRKPSVAVRAAIHGLQTNQDRKDFQLDMSTYGDIQNGEVCLGCMATVSVQSLANAHFTVADIQNYRLRANACKAERGEVHLFEYAMNSLRLNDSEMLYEFCGVLLEKDLPKHVPAVNPDVDGLPDTNNCDSVVLSGRPSKEQVQVAIARLTKLAIELEAKGF